jgi:hypothetical protein
VKNLSIPLRLCVFARKKEKESSAPQFCGAGYKAAKNWELFLCACLPQASAAKSISTLFPSYFLFISRSEAESISILFPLYFQFGTLYK